MNRRLLFISLLSLCLYARDKDKIKKNKVPTITKEHTIRRRINRNFTITLPANPTTGYSWQFAKPINRNYLELIKSEYVRPETKRIGAGGIQEWTFKTKKPGTTVIELEYVRPWQKNAPPVRTHSFTIEIVKKK